MCDWQTPETITARESEKKNSTLDSCPQHQQMLTDFQNSFTVGLSSDRVMNGSRT